MLLVRRDLISHCEHCLLGQASYRRGGPLAVTDCNVLLGRLRPEFFGNIFGHKADETLDVDVVKDKFATLTEEINAANPLVQPLTPEQTAVGAVPKSGLAYLTIF